MARRRNRSRAERARRKREREAGRSDRLATETTGTDQPAISIGLQDGPDAVAGSRVTETADDQREDLAMHDGAAEILSRFVDGAGEVLPDDELVANPHIRADARTLLEYLPTKLSDDQVRAFHKAMIAVVASPKTTPREKRACYDSVIKAAEKERQIVAEERRYVDEQLEKLQPPPLRPRSAESQHNHIHFHGSDGKRFRSPKEVWAQMLRDGVMEKIAAEKG